jgi:DNA modification methylase
MMGTGATGIAALKLKRQFLGIEKDMETFELAKRNISNIQ